MNVEEMNGEDVAAMFGLMFEMDTFVDYGNNTVELLQNRETNENSLPINGTQQPDENVQEIQASESDTQLAPPLPSGRNFAVVDVDEFLEKSENCNTRKKTESDMGVFNEFLLSRDERRSVEFIPPDILDNYLCQFLLAVKKKDGREYEPTSLRGFISSIDRHLKTKMSKMSIINDADFHKTRLVLKGKQKSLKRDGYGNKPRTSEPLTDNQVEMMYKANTLGDANPRALIHSLWLICTTYFGMRTGKECHTLCWGDVVLQTDDNTGDDFIMMDTERQTKTRTGQNPRDTRALKPKAFAIPEDPKRDPVHLYKLYSEKRPMDTKSDDSPFFLTPGNSTQKCWFRKTPMGINKLYAIMKEMKEDAGIEAPHITPYSARKRLVQKLNDEGIPANHIAQISGHKNVNSINNYCQLNREQCRGISNILSDRPRNTIAPSTTATATSTNTDSRGFFVNSHFHGNVNFHFSTTSNTRTETAQLSQNVLHCESQSLNSPAARPFKRIRVLSDTDSD